MPDEYLLAPVEIRLTVQGMKHSIVQCLTDYEGQIQAGIRTAAMKYLDTCESCSKKSKEEKL